MNEEIINKVGAWIDAMAVKLGVAGSFVFEAAVRYQMASAISVLFFNLVIAGLFIGLGYKLSSFIVGKCLQDGKIVSFKEAEPYLVLLLFAIIPIVFSTVYVTGLIEGARNAVPRLIAPEYAVIKDIMGAVK